MQMNQREQKWLVLLYSLMELDGGGQRKHVLQHIQQNGYWYKNDGNDVLRATRNEKSWRNDFSFERQHLVDRGYMRSGVRGTWEITEAGRDYAASLIEKLEGAPLESGACFTAMFYQKIFHAQLEPEYAADQMLLEQLSQPDVAPDDPQAPLLDAPLPRGPVSNRSGRRNTYLRDPAVARRALARARHCCEADASHASFPRRNSNLPYMEPHHLIPMSMTDRFGVSLDREQNIFSLCSNCHNQIHYGTREDVRRLVARLFLSREREICAILGQSITLEEIYRIYGVS